MRALKVKPELSQRKIVIELSISVCGAHYLLRAHIQRGLVKTDNF